MIKEGYLHTKKREKFLFTDEDLDNCITSLSTDPDVDFMHEEMRSQITLLTQAYPFSGARVGAFLHDFTREVKAKAKCCAPCKPVNNRYHYCCPLYLRGSPVPPGCHPYRS